MSEDVWKPHVTVAAVIERDGRFLLVEELNSQGERVLNQPAGHLDPDETLVEACRRETLEETGWQFTPTHLLGIYRWINPRDGETFLRYSFSGILQEQLSPTPPDETILKTHWLTPAELADYPAALRSVLVTHCINDYLEGKRHPLSLMQDVLEPTVA